MTEKSCCRCGTNPAGLPAPPYAGDFGQELQESVCPACWEEWQLMQTRVINEYRLRLYDPTHRQRLDQACRQFMNLEGGAPPPTGDPGGGETGS